MGDRSSGLGHDPVSRRRLLHLGLLGAAGTLLAACSSAQPAAPGQNAAPTTAPTGKAPAPASSAGNVDVTFVTTQTNEADVKIYQQLADAFHAENPNITVKISPTDRTNYDQKLLTYIQ